MMCFVLFTVTALQNLYFTSGCSQYLEQNQALQEYQNASSIFPLGETWYGKYRNYKPDPFFGGAATCLTFSQTEPGKNGAFNLVSHYTPAPTNPYSCGSSRIYRTFSGPQSMKQTEIGLKVTLGSIPGYSVKNIISFQTQAVDGSIQAYTMYKDARCLILRLPYAAADACVLMVPKSQLGKKNLCCDFIFDLLCGITTKFTLHDNSCA